MSEAANTNTAPIFIAYAIPNRDCGQYSAGGISSKQAYLAWIQGLSDGIGSGEAIIILEPDAIGLLKHCEETDDAFDPVDQVDSLRKAVEILTSNPNRYVYIDVGHWVEAKFAADTIVSIDPNQKLRGYSTNVSNYKLTSRMETRCQEVYNQLPNTHKLPCVIDTSRNKNGGFDVPGDDSWCNPPEQGLGETPQWINSPQVDGYLWLKVPGESDGECERNEPPAGMFWLERAIDLYQRSLN